MPIRDLYCPVPECAKEYPDTLHLGRDDDRTKCEACGSTLEAHPPLTSQPQGDFGTPRRSAYRMEKYVDERLSGKDKGGPLQEAIRRTGRKPATDNPESLGLKNVGDK